MQECRDGSRPQPSDLSLVAEIRRTFAAAWHRKAQLAGRLWPLAAVPAAFAAFVLRNGGVVVGDRSAHAPVKHLMQPLYSFGFSALALAPVLLRPARWVQWLCSAVVAVLLIWESHNCKVVWGASVLNNHSGCAGFVTLLGR